MDIGKLNKIAGKVYKEMLLQTVLLYQTQVDLSDEKTVKRLMSNTTAYLIYKFMMGFAILVSSILTALSVKNLTNAGGWNSFVKSTIFLTQYYVTILAMMLFFGVFFSSSLLSRDLYIPLFALNLTDSEILTIFILVYLKTFDFFAILAIFSLPIVLIILKFPILSVILAFIASIITVLISLELTIIIGKVFREKISYATKSTLKNAIRIIFLFLWAFIIYFIFSLNWLFYQIAQYITPLLINLPIIIWYFILVIFPINLSSIITQASGITTNNYFLLGASIISTILYALIAYFGLIKLYQNFRNILFSTPMVEKTEHLETRIGLKTRSKLATLILKDIKLTMRNPSYAVTAFFGIMMYLFYLILYRLDVIPYITFLSTLHIVAFFYPTFGISLLFIDEKAGRYIFSLPITLEEFLKSKVLLITIFYTVYVALLDIMFFIEPIKISFLIAVNLSIMGVYASTRILLIQNLKDIITKGISLSTILRSVKRLLITIILLLLMIELPIIIAQLFPINMINIAILLGLNLFYLAISYLVPVPEF